MIQTLLRTLISILATHRRLALENLALRQQIAVLQRSVKRPHLKKSDRIFWVLLSRIWVDWAEMLTIVRPETVIRWHRKRLQAVLDLEKPSERTGSTSRKRFHGTPPRDISSMIATESTVQSSQAVSVTWASRK